MGADQAPEPPAFFDDSRAALTFALNATEVTMPRPSMNKAMAEARAAVRKAPKRRRRAVIDVFRKNGEALALLEAENAPQARSGARAGPPPFRGLDRAAQAGFILAQLRAVDHAQQLVLKGLLIRAYDPCACRAPCCSGWRRNARWADVVKSTCLHLAEVGEVTREPGKKGLSTQPALRLAFVEQFFTKNTMTVARAAALGKVSTMTATRHRDWIFEYLEQVENDAWLRVDTLFDQVGITGSFN